MFFPLCGRTAGRWNLPRTIFVPTALGAVTLATLYEAFLTVCWGPDGHELSTRDGKKHDLRRSSSVLSGWESE